MLKVAGELMWGLGACFTVIGVSALMVLGWLLFEMPLKAAHLVNRGIHDRLPVKNTARLGGQN